MMGTLLVVDDRVDICELVQSHLVEHGHAVASATDSAAARALLSRERYDLAIIDVLMPGEGGLSLAAWAARQGVRVLLMSGHPRTIDLDADGPHYPLLRKPFRLADLDAALAALLDPPVSASR
jgi:two-component system, OmpR family, response regulator